eukprot:INCI3161.3.p1 GENE.INCI3161.3~~INCI3161.3.p1  ORF type:complete len:135 (+),score=25.39 INCI3161.3:160-564(+)
MLRRVASAFGACTLRAHSPALHQQNNIGSVRFLRGNARRVAVVLLDDNISRKGDAGDVIEVRPGYARNKLIPQKLAKYATPENVAQFGKAALEAAAAAAAADGIRNCNGCSGPLGRRLSARDDDILDSLTHPRM